MYALSKFTSNVQTHKKKEKTFEHIFIRHTAHLLISLKMKKLKDTLYFRPFMQPPIDPSNHTSRAFGLAVRLVEPVGKSKASWSVGIT